MGKKKKKKLKISYDIETLPPGFYTVAFDKVKATKDGKVFLKSLRIV